ncbi:hypothetical protein GE061_009484 [Apolygus lucorum]|uniref:Major facilitator superfamily (MFS) profile domain-containing protein n=1 Tax=Apolygus lucorum TaxID=248454 RepID=A0A8S9Y2D8_APOLU|nr:hypothetical protein GE061_009484 [Apolygus lucorum]
MVKLARIQGRRLFSWFCIHRFEDDARTRIDVDGVSESHSQPAMGKDGEAGFIVPESNDPSSQVNNYGRWKQYYATFVVCLAAYSTGLASGWASPMLIRLKSNDSPVGNMTLTEMSYLESIPTISGLVAVYFFGTVIDSFGRKPAGYVVSLISIVGWLLLVVASRPLHLYIGRFFTGFSSVGGLTVGPIFLSEVVHETRRGTLMAFMMVLTNIAGVQSYVLGDILSYRLFNITCIISSLLFPLFFYWLPESPFYLISKLKPEEAETSLLWYRGGNKEIVSQELSNISNARRVGTLPEVISNEVVPPQIKGASSMISGTVTLSVMFVCLQAFAFIREHIGLYANFVYPTFTNFLACIIAYHMLPETRGKEENDGHRIRYITKEQRLLPGFWRQLYATIAVCFAAFSSGNVLGWVGPMMLELPVPDGPVKGVNPDTLNQVFTWMQLSSIFNMMTCGFLMDNMGRRAGCWFLNLIAPAGWVFFATAQTPSDLFIGGLMVSATMGAVSFGAFSSGNVLGWSGPMVLKMRGNETTIEEPYEVGSFNTMLSIMAISSIFGMMVCGYLMDTVGRKAGCWFLTLFAPAGWVFLAQARTHSDLYVGGAMVGSILAAGPVVGIVLVTEVTNDNVRGPLLTKLKLKQALNGIMGMIWKSLKFKCKSSKKLYVLRHDFNACQYFPPEGADAL